MRKKEVKCLITGIMIMYSENLIKPTHTRKPIEILSELIKVILHKSVYKILFYF